MTETVSQPDIIGDANISRLHTMLTGAQVMLEGRRIISDIGEEAACREKVIPLHFPRDREDLLRIVAESKKILDRRSNDGERS